MIIIGSLASMKTPSSSGQIIHKEMLCLPSFPSPENPFSIPFYREKLQTSACAETGGWEIGTANGNSPNVILHGGFISKLVLSNSLEFYDL